MIGFKCHTCKGFIRIPKVGEPSKPMLFKWKNNKKDTKVQVCEKCHSRLRSLKCD